MMHKNDGNRDNYFKNYKSMDFLLILDTAYGSHFWLVPSQFKIFWSPALDIHVILLMFDYFVTDDKFSFFVTDRHIFYFVTDRHF